MAAGTATKASAAQVEAAAKVATGQGSPAAVAQRRTTREQNSELSIDYSHARDEGSFSATGRTSMWVQKLNLLAADCADPDTGAAWGKAYQIGSFGTASTAQSTKKRIETDLVDQLHGVFMLMAERTETGSALWAAAYEPESENGEDEWETDDGPALKAVAGEDGDE